MGDLADQAALATLRTTFPDLEVIEVVQHDGSNMTEQTEGWGDEQAEGAPVPPAAVSYPEHVKDPHNHRYTISVDGRGPMVVVRAQSAQEVNEAFQELLDANTGALMGSFWGAFKGTAQVANGSAPAPQAPAQQAAQQYPTPPQPGPQQVPNQPYQGQPAWQQAGAPQGQPQQQQQWGGQQQRPAQSAPQGWYRMNVPYPGGKDQLNAIAAQNGVPKGNPSKGGMYNFWSAPTKAWYCDPQVAQVFAQFQPVPA